MHRTPGPNENLSRDEAAWRARTLQVLSYRVELDLSRGAGPGGGRLPLEHHAGLRRPRGTTGTFLDFIHESIESITLNGAPVDPAAAVAGSRIYLTGLRRGRDAANTVVIDGHARYSRSGEGLHRYVDPADGQTYCYTQYEPADARRVFANFEQPDLKAPLHLHRARPAGLARGLQPGRPPASRSTATAPRPRDFAPTLPISTYITTVLAGPYFVADRHLPPHPGRRHRAGDPAERLPAAPRWPSTSIAENILDAHQAPGWTSSTSSSTTPTRGASTTRPSSPNTTSAPWRTPGWSPSPRPTSSPPGPPRRSTRPRANTHHARDGAHVVRRPGHHALVGRPVAQGVLRRLHGHPGRAPRPPSSPTPGSPSPTAARPGPTSQDQLPTTHPIVADITDLEAAKQNFDGITYAKGASVLKQLVAYVGAEAFLDAARSYFRAHAYGNTTLTDFLAALEAASGRDMGAWADAWLQTAGVPRLGLELETGRRDDHRRAAHPVGHRPDHREPHHPPARAERGRCSTSSTAPWSAPRPTAWNSPATASTLPFLAGPAAPGPDPAQRRGRHLRHGGLRRGLPGDAAGRTWARSPIRWPAPPAGRRCGTWCATRNCRPPEFLAAVRAHAGSVTEVGVFNQLLAQATTAVNRYLPPELRDAERRALAAALTSWLESRRTG